MAILTDYKDLPMKDALGKRAMDLKNAIARSSSVMNPDPTTLANIAQFQAELGEINSQLDEGKTNDILELFNQYAPDVDTSADEATIRELFGQQEEQQMRGLDERFMDQRKTAIDEAAATGNLRQPGFLTKGLGSIDALKARAAQELMSSLGLGQSQAILDSRANARTMGMNKASAMAGIKQGGQQFADSLGFNRERFGADNVLQKRQQDLDELFRRDSLSESIRTRDDAKPGLMDKIGKGVSLGRNIVGGIGDIMDVGKKGVGAGASGGLFR